QGPAEHSRLTFSVWDHRPRGQGALSQPVDILRFRPVLQGPLPPIDSWNPFSLVLKTGSGSFGSPTSSPMVMSRSHGQHESPHEESRRDEFSVGA
ncbi:unnamed protein product, partial [Linum tenue]